MHGWRVQTPTTSACSIEITNGQTGATGLVLGAVVLAADSVDVQWFDEGLDAGDSLSIQVISGECSVTLYHSTDVSASLRITDGATGAAGLVLASIKVMPDESNVQWFERGITAGTNLSIDHISGTSDVTLYYTTGNS